MSTASPGRPPNIPNIPNFVVSRRVNGRRYLCLSLVLAGLFLVGCGKEPLAEVVSAEFLDEIPDGRASQDETILVRLDRVLPPEFRLQSVRVQSVPPMTWSPQVGLTADRRTLEIKIRTGAPPFLFEGVHGQSAAATGLVVDLGDGRAQVVDLHRVRIVPKLLRVVWEDSSPTGGNGVVDQGDTLRLLFDQPVHLGTSETPGDDRVLVPRHVVLTKDGVDRLDDGSHPSIFRAGQKPSEIDIVLGSRPVLTVEGDGARDPSNIERADPRAPSALALNGTDLYPMSRIEARGGGPGVASEREVDIEFAAGYQILRSQPREELAAPASRVFHTVTPLVLNQALVAGGASTHEMKALDGVLIYNPTPGSEDAQPFRRLSPGLPAPTYNHTATLLPGRDEKLGTIDDFVVLAGGEDGQQALSTLSVVRFRFPEYAVEKVETSLRVPRAEHAAVAVSASSVLIDGGRTYGSDREEALVGCAELLTFGIDEENDKVAVTAHVVFRTLPRVDHSLTLLASDDSEAPWVLAYGGYGDNPYSGFDERGLTTQRHQPLQTSVGQILDGNLPDDIFLSIQEGRVLVSPVLINVSRSTKSLANLARLDFTPSLLRRKHAAAGIGEKNASGLLAATSVILCGGTLRHPTRGVTGEPLSLWELPLVYRYGGGREPESHQALNAIRFTFDLDTPVNSRLEVLPHPSPTPSDVPTRVNFTATRVPGLGIVLAGGELPPVLPRDPRPLASLEVFLTDKQRLAEFVALELHAPRSRHRAYLVTDGETGKHSVILIGGVGEGGIAYVEEIPLPGGNRREE